MAVRTTSHFLEHYFGRWNLTRQEYAKLFELGWRSGNGSVRVENFRHSNRYDCKEIKRRGCPRESLEQLITVTEGRLVLPWDDAGRFSFTVCIATDGFQNYRRVRDYNSPESLTRYLNPGEPAGTEW